MKGVSLGLAAAVLLACGFVAWAIWPFVLYALR